MLLTFFNPILVLSVLFCPGFTVLWSNRFPSTTVLSTEV